MDSNQVKHLEMIQDIINRMARNSFMYKGWALTIFAALIIFFTKDCIFSISGLIERVIAMVPIFGFWILDAYYLRQERLFRALYDSVRLGKNPDRFSMKTAPKPYLDKVDSLIDRIFVTRIAASVADRQGSIWPVKNGY